MVACPPNHCPFGSICTCQAHLSWSQKNIAAIFYVNDTLSHTLVDPALRGSRAKRLADQTKLLPPLARAASNAPNPTPADVARRMRDIAAAAAANALSLARRAQQQLGVAERSGSERGPIVYPPIVQLRLSRECFDTQPLSQRLAAADDPSRPEPYQPGCELPDDFLVEPPPMSDAEAAAQDAASCGSSGRAATAAASSYRSTGPPRASGGVGQAQGAPNELM